MQQCHALHSSHTLMIAALSYAQLRRAQLSVWVDVRWRCMWRARAWNPLSRVPLPMSGANHRMFGARISGCILNQRRPITLGSLPHQIGCVCVFSVVRLVWPVAACPRFSLLSRYAQACIVQELKRELRELRSVSIANLPAICLPGVVRVRVHPHSLHLTSDDSPMRCGFCRNHDISISASRPDMAYRCQVCDFGACVTCASAELVVPVRLRIGLGVLARLVFQHVFACLRCVFALSSSQKHVRPSCGSGSALAHESAPAVDAMSISNSKSSPSSDPVRLGVLGPASSLQRGRIIHRVCLQFYSSSFFCARW